MKVLVCARRPHGLVKVRVVLWLWWWELNRTRKATAVCYFEENKKGENEVPGTVLLSHIFVSEPIESMVFEVSGEFRVGVERWRQSY